MQPGVTYTDSVALGAEDFWTFQSTGSNPYSLTLTKASGGAGFCSYMELFNPSGAYLGLSSTCTSTTVGGTLAAGTIYVYVTNAYLGNGTGSYTLKVSGTGVDMSGQGNGDGATCLTCAAKQSRKAFQQQTSARFRRNLNKEDRSMNTSGTITRKSGALPVSFSALALIPVICGINAAPPAPPQSTLRPATSTTR